MGQVPEEGQCVDAHGKKFTAAERILSFSCRYTKQFVEYLYCSAWLSGFAWLAQGLLFESTPLENNGKQGFHRE
jgi:hypothetical protein